MAKVGIKGEGGFNLSPLINFFRNRIFQGIIIGIVTYTIIFGMMFLVLSPKQYDLAVGDIVEEPIKAPRDVEDRMLTEEKLEQSREKVPSVYRLDEQITDEAIEQTYNIFDSIQMIRYRVDQRIKSIVSELERELEARETAKAQERIEAGEEGQDDIIQGNNEDEELEREDTDDEEDTMKVEEPDKRTILDDHFLLELSEELPIKLSKEDIITSIMEEHSELEILQQELVQIVENVLKAGIKQENIYEARNTIRESVRNLPISAELKVLGGNIGSNVIIANMLYDHVATEAEREKAVALTEHVVYKKGQYIVQAGEPITENQLEVLSELGILRDNVIDISFTVGIGVTVFVVLLTTSLYLAFFDREVASSPAKLLIISTALIFILAISYGISLVNIYLIPTAMMGMLMAILIKPKSAIVVNTTIAILVSLLLEDGLGLGIMALCGGMAGIYILDAPEQRNTIVISGIVAGAINALTIIGIDLMGTATYNTTFVTALYALGGGFMSGVFTLGLLPVFENLFKVLTPLKLVELSNPNQPILRRLLMEAPGTYHHSVLVANLAESAADSIGANSLLARVGAYYHDVGKLKRPYFFKENQLSGENPHDQLNPTLSTHVITMHTKDGLDIARQHKVPDKIQDFIVEHHGTTAVRYFYHKAKSKDENVRLEEFRYSGPKPQSRETAIVMMADTVEAAVRSMKEPTPAKIEGFVQKLIKEKLDDGQFDECPLTLLELSKIAKSFTSVVTGIIHERIEYPDIDLNKNGDMANEN